MLAKIYGVLFLNMEASEERKKEFEANSFYFSLKPPVVFANLRENICS